MEAKTRNPEVSSGSSKKSKSINAEFYPPSPTAYARASTVRRLWRASSFLVGCPARRF